MRKRKRKEKILNTSVPTLIEEEHFNFSERSLDGLDKSTMIHLLRGLYREVEWAEASKSYTGRNDNFNSEPLEESTTAKTIVTR